MEPIKFKTPSEKIVGTDILATTVNVDKLMKTGYERIVDLACGHKAVTSNLHRCHCARCQQMFDSGYDWDGYRNLGMKDEMIWPEDPLRIFHEPHDLSGNPLNG